MYIHIFLYKASTKINLNFVSIFLYNCTVEAVELFQKKICAVKGSYLNSECLLTSSTF